METKRVFFPWLLSWSMRQEENSPRALKQPKVEFWGVRFGGLGIVRCAIQAACLDLVFVADFLDPLK